uniref:Transposase n=1 Tax=Angiostrongylus cantonensis TaxID=6313 RepID=A0A0K0D6Z5_ANGCA
MRNASADLKKDENIFSVFGRSHHVALDQIHSNERVLYLLRVASSIVETFILRITVADAIPTKQFAFSLLEWQDNLVKELIGRHHVESSFALDGTNG